jgi:ABC-type dipeptide/oligopeptide/nickel transport system permease subunit
MRRWSRKRQMSEKVTAVTTGSDEFIPELSTRTIILTRIGHNKMFLIGGIIVAGFILAAIGAPSITSFDPNAMDFTAQFGAPTTTHLMGTDQYGRDILARILYGTRISLLVGLASVLLGGAVGVLIGAVAGFLRGRSDTVLMRVMDGLLAFPPLLLALGLVAFMGPGLTTVCLAIGVIYIPAFARVMRSAVMTEREKEYVEAARAIGQSPAKILLRHIGPNCLSPILVQATVLFAAAIIIEASLSFLGVGIPPPTPSLGTMLDEARQTLGLPSSTHMALFPGLAISLAVLGFNLLGDGLRDILDPRLYTDRR